MPFLSVYDVLVSMIITRYLSYFVDNYMMCDTCRIGGAAAVADIMSFQETVFLIIIYIVHKLY